jgi:hypothetical protein
MLAELQFTGQSLDTCFKQYSTCKTITKIDKTIIKGLQQDKVDLLNVSEGFKKELVEKDKELTKCIIAKPSRATWFGVGFLSALLIVIVSALAIK